MGNIVVCDGVLSTANNMLTCDTGWIVKPEPVSPDFAGLVALLQFDPEICALLIGTCVLFFIIGISTGHVARNLGRA